MLKERSVYTGSRANGPRVTAIGGGHGLSTMLRGLKLYTENLTAVGPAVCGKIWACCLRGTSATAWRPWPTPSR